MFSVGVCVFVVYIICTVISLEDKACCRQPCVVVAGI